MWRALDDNDPTVLLMADEVIRATVAQPETTMTLTSEMWEAVMTQHAQMEEALAEAGIKDAFLLSIHSTALIHLAVSDFMEDKDEAYRTDDDSPVQVCLTTRALYGSFAALANGLCAGGVPLECPPESNGALAWQTLRRMATQLPEVMVDNTLIRFGLPNRSVLTEVPE